MPIQSSEIGFLVWATATAALLTGASGLLGVTPSTGRAAPIQRVSFALATSIPLPLPTATTAPAATQVPTAVRAVAVSTPVPTVVPVTPTPLPRGVVVWEETFADNQRGWPDAPNLTAWLTPGGYHIEPRDPGRFAAVSPAQSVSLGDLQVTARFRKLDGPLGGGYGIIIRDQAQSQEDGVGTLGRYYIFEVGDRAEVGIWKRDVDHWVDLIAWKPSDAVHPGTAENEVTVRAQGPLLMLIVNGVQAAQVEDPTHSAGSVGVFVGGDGNAVILTRLLVEALS